MCTFKHYTATVLLKFKMNVLLCSSHLSQKQNSGKKKNLVIFIFTSQLNLFTLRETYFKWSSLKKYTVCGL